jgi:spermidine/putrescine-binding protein
MPRFRCQVCRLDKDLLDAVYGDTVNFVVPYQIGTQGIIYNSETVRIRPAS